VRTVVAVSEHARWLARRRPVIVGVGALFVGAGRAALEALVRREPWNWGLVLLYGGAWAVGMAVFWLVVRAVARRRSERARDRVEGRAVIEEALRTGRLPDGVVPAAWRRALAEERHSTRQSRWAVAGLGLCITVLVAVAAAIDSDPVVGLLALVLLAGTVALDRWCLRRVRQADDLLDAVGAG
jgi:hypothetical protein